MKATVRILSEGNKRELFINEAQCVIGRGEDADIRIDDETVSRHHCRLFFNDGHWMLEDLGSSNGTFRGFRRVKKSVRLRSRQRFRVGQVSLSLDFAKVAPRPLTWIVAGGLAAGLIVGGAFLVTEYLPGKKRVFLGGGGSSSAATHNNAGGQIVDEATFVPVSGHNDIEMNVPPLPVDPEQKIIQRTIRISGRLRLRR